MTQVTSVALLAAAGLLATANPAAALKPLATEEVRPRSCYIKDGV